jgi:hypothetical protein
LTIKTYEIEFKQMKESLELAKEINNTDEVYFAELTATEPGSIIERINQLKDEKLPAG